MTPAQLRLAARLWRRYQTSTLQYRRLAEALGITTADLNARVAKAVWLQKKKG